MAWRRRTCVRRLRSFRGWEPVRWKREERWQGLACMATPCGVSARAPCGVRGEAAKATKRSGVEDRKTGMDVTIFLPRFGYLPFAPSPLWIGGGEYCIQSEKRSTGHIPSEFRPTTNHPHRDLPYFQMTESINGTRSKSENSYRPTADRDQLMFKKKIEINLVRAP